MSARLLDHQLCRENRKRRKTILAERRQRQRVQEHHNDQLQNYILENHTSLEIEQTEFNTQYLNLGAPEHICQHCGAIMWYEERVKKTSNRNHVNFNMCCKEGRIKLPMLKDPPEFLKKLLDYNGGPEAAKFRQQIRMYNACFAFTSMGAKIDNTINMSPGPYVFRISGQVVHRMGSLLPLEGQEPSYAQLYIYDTASEIDLRAKTVGKRDGSPVLDPRILTGLKEMLDEVNPLAQTFRMAQQRIKEDDTIRLSIKLIGTRENKDRTYDTPTASEIAALIVGDFDQYKKGRDIIIEYKTGELKRINELFPLYMPFQYPLLFPFGEDSYHVGILYVSVSEEDKSQRKREKATMREFYAYRLMFRLHEAWALHRGGRLFQQYLVDCVCAIESERLSFISNNQPQFRCDVLNNLCDAVNQGDYVGAAVGKRIFLPSSFTGGPRYMQQNYQDAMAICRQYGNPHLFITFTANAKWPEIEYMLSHIPGQRAEDRPDIVARVFKLKLKQLMDCLRKDNYFGTVIADVYTVEFQKRGLPHAHILLWLDPNDVDLCGQYIDKIIQAEIPDKNQNPNLYEAVSKYMIHGPCGEARKSSPCMIDQICSKKYPKSYNEETTFDSNGYPIYRRRQDSRFIKKGDHIMDNRSVVPYNAGLLLMFECHMNIEWCNNARSIKYLFKYLAKGTDKATVIVRQDEENEVKAYLDCRYISASEASWRILEFHIQERNPSVMRLPVHLEGQQAVVLRDKSKIQVVIDNANNSDTMLTGWMTRNSTDPDARALLYAQFPTKYVWNNSWSKRKKGRSIGRMAYVHPTAGEKYYLRMLLNIIKGATSYEDMRTVEGRVYPTYKDACCALGLLSNDKEWQEAMLEANHWAMPSRLRELFVTLILFCEVTDINNLWNQSYEMLSEDIERRKRKQFRHPDLILSDSAKKSFTLIEIDKILMKYGKRLADIKDLPKPEFEDIEGMENRLIRDEKMYDTRKLHDEWNTKIQQLNPEQLKVFEKVVKAVDNDSGDLIFLYGHGGTGKTFLYSAISAKIRAEGKIVLNVASSGIAALLLPGGRTAHSRFEIPIDLSDESTCNVSQKTQLADLLRQTSVIIWDEAPMNHRFKFEALDRTMRDVVGFTNPEGKTKIFGGKVVLLGGDFRQVLPIVHKGTRQDIVQASVNRSHIWNSCNVFLLKTSMRVREADADEEKRSRYKKFNDWLLAMGDGTLEAKIEEQDPEPTWIKIPEEFIGSTGELDIAVVIDKIYPGFQERRQDGDYLKERAILTPLNETADYINNYMTQLIPGEYRTYNSCDEICTSSTESANQFNAYPIEYLNSLTLQGLPPHELKLKEDMPVMLLRNINPSQGLCNGTRLIITRLGRFIIQARIITGSKIGREVLIPRIVMTSTEGKIPFTLKRRQYPLKPCYAMTINKSQGQSLTHVGVFLPKPVFSHGQLYVAASRTTSPEGLKFFIDDTKQTHKGHTRNIVYKEVFSNLSMLD